MYETGFRRHGDRGIRTRPVGWRGHKRLALTEEVEAENNYLSTTRVTSPGKGSTERVGTHLQELKTWDPYRYKKHFVKTLNTSITA